MRRKSPCRIGALKLEQHLPLQRREDSPRLISKGTRATANAVQRTDAHSLKQINRVNRCEERRKERLAVEAAFDEACNVKAKRWQWRLAHRHLDYARSQAAKREREILETTSLGALIK